MDSCYSRRDTLTALSAGFVGIALAGCAGSGDNGQVTVEMTDELIFDPDDLTLSSGATVVWENAGTAGHTVTAYEDRIPADAAYFASGGFGSEQAARDTPRDGLLRGDDSFQHTFETTGTFDYFCIPHEGTGMLGSITVE